MGLCMGLMLRMGVVSSLRSSRLGVLLIEMEEEIEIMLNHLLALYHTQ